MAIIAIPTTAIMIPVLKRLFNAILLVLKSIQLLAHQNHYKSTRIHKIAFPTITIDLGLCEITLDRLVVFINRVIIDRRIMSWAWIVSM
jgi:hypothetical protein